MAVAEQIFLGVDELQDLDNRGVQQLIELIQGGNDSHLVCIQTCFHAVGGHVQSVKEGLVAWHLLGNDDH